MKFLTVDEKAELVEEYMDPPHGKKASWRAERDIPSSTILRWRRGYLFGDLARGLIPRTSSAIRYRTDMEALIVRA